MTAHQHIPESARETCENGTLSRRRLGLIGYPIGHSLSPTLFREYFASRPDILEQWEYDLIERSTFDEARAAFLQDYTAVNVTAPFKENAFRTADSHDYSALRCQASNLLVKTTSEGVKAYNTDFEAVLDILRQEHTAFQTGATGKTEKDHEMRKMKVLVIGAGGAGKAAAAAAVEAGMQTSIWNRTSGRAIEFADHLHQYDPHGLGSVTRIIGTPSVPFENSCPATDPTTVSAPEHRNPDRAHASIPQDIQPDTINFIQAELLTAVRQSDIIVYTLPGPSTSDHTFHRTKAECSFLTLLDTEPDILSGKTVIEANYKDPVLADTPCRRYISGLTWLRLQAIATYRIVLGPSFL